MLDLFGQEIKPSETPLSANMSKSIKIDSVGNSIKLNKTINPCLALYGNGPDDLTCKDCVHLRYAIERNPQVRHWKCDMRRLTHGAATDHRVRYPACGRYEQRTEEYHGG